MSVSLRDVTRTLSEVARLSASPSDVDQLLTSALDALAEAIPYDLAAVLELVEGQLEVRCARGPLATERVAKHQFRLEPGSTVDRALHSRRARVMEESEHAEGEDPYHGLIDLPDGHGCLVVPLVAADESLGVMTFDRASCGVYPPETVELATVYGQLVALALLAARHAASLEQDKARLQEQNRFLSEEMRVDGSAGRLLAGSQAPAMSKAVDLARQVARTEAPVLITGETGTGKEVLARAIHEWSDRVDAPFVKINCAALPEALLESELFGHVEGAFSGATRDRPGRFLVADGGTLMLDEIGDMPLAAQAKLLRVLQEGTIEPVGSDRTVTVDVRILAATHVDLKAAIEQGRFREDLYYRLGMFPIHLPPLRERGEDVVRLAERLLLELGRRTGRGPWTLGASAQRQLRTHRWPGNVRELVNALERATILCGAGAIELEVGAAPPAKAASEGLEGLLPAADAETWPSLAELETAYLARSLERAGGKIYGEDGAAHLVGMKPSTLQSRLQKRGLSRASR